MEKKQWLPHLETSLPKEAHGYPISMYSIALEGWRRGLSVKFENNNRVRAVIRYSLSDGKKTHYFMGSRGDLVTEKAIEICGNKSLTKKYLAKAGVSIAEGEVFGEDAADEALINYAASLGFPVVIKPVSGAGGRGVIANIQDKESFAEALNYVKHKLKHRKVIVERHIEGDDYRVYVVGNKVIGAVNRIPANIIGDGKQTIAQLLRQKNNEKKLNPALTDSPIRNDGEVASLLKSRGYTLESVPPKGERVFLKSKSNISAGGEPVDATDLLSDEVKSNAVKAVEAIPELVQGGVDILWDQKTNEMAVLEINTLPSIRTHLFPLEGKARDIPKAIVDYYFPETKANHKHPLYYFEISEVFHSFTNNTLTEAAIPDYPQGDLISERLIVKNVKRPQTFMSQKFKAAKRQYLNGHIQSLNKSEIEIVLSGRKDEVEKFAQALAKEAGSGKIEREEWTEPVKIGFERIREQKGTKKSRASRGYKNPLSSSDILEREYERMVKERDFYKNKYEKVSNSKVWRLANAFRKFMPNK